MKTYYRHHLGAENIINVGRVRLKLVKHCGGIDTKEQEDKARAEATDWFQNDYFYGTDSHRLVISKSVLYAAVILK